MAAFPSGRNSSATSPRVSAWRALAFAGLTFTALSESGSFGVTIAKFSDHVVAFRMTPGSRPQGFATRLIGVCATPCANPARIGYQYILEREMLKAQDALATGPRV